MSNTKRILMVAAENDALPGAKVGGVGDVVRDLPHALVDENTSVDVCIPSYGFLARLKGVVSCGYIEVSFGLKQYSVEVLKYEREEGGAGQYILHHERFAPKGETIYCDDEGFQPFATDATKFAFFNVALAKALIDGVIPWPDYMHCHDWHAAFILILRQFGHSYTKLKEIKTVFSIHNLAMQGVRPFLGDESAFVNWFPGVKYDLETICDPRYKHCINPLRAGILLADKVHTVSPTYAKEIMSPSYHSEGIYGGEGLEEDLLYRDRQGDLVGILNGCEYPVGVKYTKPARKKLVDVITPLFEEWSGPHHYVPTANWIGERRLKSWLARKSIGLTVTSIGRLTEQKIRILQTTCTLGVTVLQGILNMLGDRGVLFILGSGNREIETFISDVAAKNSNLIFLNGYSNEVSSLLYNFGDVFLMPSSFEPCGISQLLAMRSGQPCIVNGVGGLKDTVEHNKTGFVFTGNNLKEQADQLLGLFEEVLDIYDKDPVKLKVMSKQASQVRFTWEKSAEQYHNYLYV